MQANCIKEISEYLSAHGPTRGKELSEVFFCDSYDLWFKCMTSPQFLTKSVAKYYLRLDKNLHGYARLSPSIWREFFSYTLIGLNSQPELIEEKATWLKSEISSISKIKSDLAFSVCNSVYEHLSYNYPLLKTNVVFLLAGDIVHNMAHNDPRPEKTTGELVIGSDIDLIVIVSDKVNKKITKLVEDSLYEMKFKLLNNPFQKEELDFVVKTEFQLRNQMKMESFKEMVAMKVFCEARFLCGNLDYFKELASDPKFEVIKSQFREMEERAIISRKQALDILLKGTKPEASSWLQTLFYPAEEAEEF